MSLTLSKKWNLIYCQFSKVPSTHHHPRRSFEESKANNCHFSKTCSTTLCLVSHDDLLARKFRPSITIKSLTLAQERYFSATFAISSATLQASFHETSARTFPNERREIRVWRGHNWYRIHCQWTSLFLEKGWRIYGWTFDIEIFLLFFLGRVTLGKEIFFSKENCYYYFF